MNCECGGDFKITGDISDDKDICPHIVIRCVECEKAHNIFYFKDLAEEMEAKAEKAEAELAELKEVNAKQEEEIERLTEMIEK